MQDFYPSRCSSQARRLPRLDPALHGAWNPTSPLTRQQALQFDRDGYIILENIFSAAEVALLQTETARLLGDTSSLDPATIIMEPDGQEVRSIFRIHGQSPLMSRLAADERLAGVARFLLDDRVYVHQSRLNYKPGFYGKEFYWHSDFETWHVEDGMPRMRALSMSILLVENTPQNGPLMLIPGSHRSFLSCIGETPDNHYQASLRKQEYGVPDDVSLAELVRENGIVTATGVPGTVIIFDSNIMHGSNSNITPLPRANAFFVYNALSNRLVEPFGPPSPRPEFIAVRSPEPICMVTGPLTDGPA